MLVSAYDCCFCSSTMQNKIDETALPSSEVLCIKITLKQICDIRKHRVCLYVNDYIDIILFPPQVLFLFLCQLFPSSVLHIFSLRQVLGFLNDHLFSNFICEVLRGILSSYIHNVYPYHCILNLTSYSYGVSTFTSCLLTCFEYFLIYPFFVSYYMCKDVELKYSCRI